EFDLSLITSSKDKKNNIYLCIKGSFGKEENRDRIDLLVTPIKILSALIQLISKIKKKQTVFSD
ncbi:hypothetical protein ABHZ61_19020, partial [Bacteroides thetaiotaomicron]|uniref:hypothetical protein n=1 Tax=Bacteroides thetaiotaomicron TaxID=818 RepID=UPI0032602CD0